MSLRDLGRSLVRRLPGLDPVARRLYGLLPSALHDTPTSWMRQVLGAAPSVSFVQIGAFDGCAGDPVRSLVVENAGWRGVLVEPQPGAFATLVRNYAGQASRLDFVNAAVAAAAGETMLYVVPEHEIERLGLPAWIRETASFTRAHVERHVAHCQIDEVRVRSMTFADVASRLPHGWVDLVVVDVEGYEKILLETIDYDRHRVRFVVYEHKHLSETDSASTTDLLARHGFSWKAFGRDTIAWRDLP